LGRGQEWRILGGNHMIYAKLLLFFAIIGLIILLLEAVANKGYDPTIVLVGVIVLLILILKRT